MGGAPSGRSARSGIPDPGKNGYAGPVNKTTIQFDPGKRDAVAAVLGTKGLKATVDAAFDAVLRQHAGRELVRLAQEGGVELTNEEVESRAWGD
jgi:Arc/MetJ family transcription regulator